MSSPRWLLLVSFFSGAAGLIFEIVWFHRAGLVFGSSVWATSLVLSSFMGGLALGSAAVAYAGPRLRSLLRAYAAAEILVAVTGVAITYVLPEVGQGVARLAGPNAAPWWSGAVRFTGAFAALLVPATGMGATQPLLVAAVAQRRPATFGTALGRVYGWNTLGAVAGVIAAELWLVAWVGVSRSALIAGIIGTAAASMVLLGASEPVPVAFDVPSPERQRRPSNGPRPVLRAIRPIPLLACSFLTGAALLALEVIWFRFLTMFVLSTTLAASLMLAVVLTAIGFGGLLASIALRRHSDAALQLPVVALLAGCAVVASYAAFEWLTGGAQVGSPMRTVWLSGVLTLPASLISGALFALVGDALQRAIVSEPRAAGWLTVANTAGGACGPLVAAFVLLPMIGTETSLFTLAIVYAAIGALSLVGVGSWNAARRSPAFAVGGMALLAALVWFPFGLMDGAYLPRVVRPYAVDGSEIVATREGPSETIVLMQQSWLGEAVYHRLVTNGFSMSGTSVPAMRYMRYFVYLPGVLHAGPIRRALVICYGVGITAGAALDLPGLESLDVVEISPEVVSTSDLIYGSNSPLRDPRVRLRIDDGRQVLQSVGEQFDLITGEPPPPRTPGAVNIYTREYFQLIADRLAEGGIATYWLPVGRPDPGTNVNAIIAAFCEVFDDCSLWNATPFDFVLVGTRQAPGPLSEDEFVESWTIPALRARFAEVGLELPQQVGATFLGDAAYLRELTRGLPALVDDFPQRLHPMPDWPSLSDPGYGTNRAVTALYDAVIDPARARRAFEASEFIARLWPARALDATLPFFERQATLNRVLWEGGRPLARIEDLHALLTETPLRTLPLWLLGSDFVKERIALGGEDPGGADEYARGLSALSKRDYPGAAAAFADAERAGLAGEALRPLRVYALAMGGHLDEASGLSQDVPVGSSDAQHFWKWIGAQFRIGPFAAE